MDAWASLKSFRPKGEGKQKPPDDPGNPAVNFHGEKRSNETHESKIDPEVLLARKGDRREARLSYSANALMENRNGLIVDLVVEPADGFAERRSALTMLARLKERRPGRVTLGADKGYDVASFVAGCRELGVTPHVAQWRRPPTPGGGPPWTAGQPGTRATPSASEPGSPSRKSSGG
jgi:hypothetical protein